MESDLHPHQLGSGLMRYQSAPSSYFSSFIDSDDFFPRRPLSPETERIFARFMNSGADTAPEHQHLMGSIKTETIIHEHHNQPSNFYASQPPRPPMKMEGNNSNLVRQRSSPPGLLSNINSENELASYGVIRDLGNIGPNNETSFSSGMPGSSALSTIGETEIKPMGGMGNPEGGGSLNDSYVTGYPIGSWDDSAVMLNKIGNLKRARDDFGTETQCGEAGTRRPPILAHHLSLQNTSAEMAAIDNFFQFQDSVPCKIRAKRGCATHPRSIAERVRRTKISERMRKLQELVPNMDKQTNTSDMLDLAVEYIKELQREVEKLADNRSKCTCPHKEQS